MGNSASSNTAIIALIVIFVLVFLGIFLYYSEAKQESAEETQAVQEAVVPQLDIDLDAPEGDTAPGGSNR